MMNKPTLTVEEEIEHWRAHGENGKWGVLVTDVFVNRLISEIERLKNMPSAGDAYSRGYQDGLTANG